MSAPLIGHYCGRQVLPPLIKSHGNQLWVRFKTDGSVEGRGFRAAYRTTIGEAQGCGGTYIRILSLAFTCSNDPDRSIRVIV